jgi:hypothetical protein
MSLRPNAIIDFDLTRLAMPIFCSLGNFELASTSKATVIIPALSMLCRACFTAATSVTNCCSIAVPNARLRPIGAGAAYGVLSSHSFIRAQLAKKLLRFSCVGA